jgi:hypothetical protein
VVPEEALPLVPLEVKVRDRAREFTLPALLDVLRFLNYRSEDIEFRSHMSYARPSSLIHSVEFLGDEYGATAPPGVPPRRTNNSGRRKVVVTVNLGLLSVQSPLPSYLLKFAESLEGETLIDFLGFFDHHLIKRRAMSLHPERDRTVFADWAQAQSELLQMLGLGAPSTLYWLCERIYPELGIRVERSTAQKPLRAQGAVLGHAVLGEGCAFGAETSVPVGGIDITLYSDEVQSPTGVPWPKEAAQRMHQQLFKLIGGSELYLRVYLIMMDQANWLELRKDRFLGYEPMWDPSRQVPLPSPHADHRRSPPPLAKAMSELRSRQPDSQVLRRDGKGSALVPSGGGPAPSPASTAQSPRIHIPPDERERERETRARRRIYQVQLFAGPLKHAKSEPQDDPIFQNVDEYLVVSDG